MNRSKSLGSSCVSGEGCIKCRGKDGGGGCHGDSSLVQAVLEGRLNTMQGQGWMAL